MQKVFFLIFTAISLVSFSQGVTSNWHFGNRAGVTFENFIPSANNQNILNLNGACTSISDINSNLLFYSETDSCIDSTFEFIQGSENLTGNSLTYQGAIIVSCPNNPSTYFLFTVNPNLPRTLFISTIRKTLQFPEGVMAENEKNVAIAFNNAGKLTAVHHTNGQDVWLITRTFIGDTIRAYLITENGLNLNPVESIQNTNNLFTSLLGQLKSSNNGRYLAECTGYGNSTNPFTRFYKFDTSTGTASSAINLYPGIISDSRLGLEFDVTSQFVYITKMYNTAPNRLYRYDISNYDSTALISSMDSFDLPKQVESLQIGIDRKIYGSQYLDSFLFRIENPSESTFSSLDFNDTSVSLNGKLCLLGLPDFITSYFRPGYFDYTNACIGDSVLFIQRYPNPDSVRWNFGDPASTDNTSLAFEPKHLFTDTGTFTVTLRVYAGTIADTFSKEIRLIAPPANWQLSDTTIICVGDSVLFNISQNVDFAKYLWINGSEEPSISISDSGQVWGVIYNQCDTIYDTTFVAFDDTLQLQPLPDTSFCESDTLQLLAKANSRATWLWSNGDSSAHTNFFDVSDNQFAVWVTATNACGSASDTFQINAFPQPNVDWFSDSILCDASSPFIAEPSSFGVNYSLLFYADSLDSWMVDTAGLYYLVAENQCDTLVKSAFLSPQQIIEKELLQSITICPGEEVVLDAFWEGSSYVWSDNVNTELVNDSAIVVSAPLNHQSNQETYTVTITNPPCARSLSTTVIFLSEDSCGNTCAFSVPNVFTPNQDGVNDAFRITNTCESKNFRFSVYNRWGALVHSGTGSIAYWDGTSNGAYVNSGVYFVIIEYTNLAGQEKTVRTAVSVLR